MSRKFALILVILLLVLIGSALHDLPVIAAPQAQEGKLPERERPGMDSYHGKEEIPYMPGMALPDVEEEVVTSPVEGWSRMAFRSYLDNEGEYEIYSANGDFTNLVRLTYGGGYDSNPRLNRGGTRIVFFSDRGGDQYDIYAINPDSYNLTRLTYSEADDVMPVWSPDGTRIAFQSYRDGQAEVYLMNADGSGQTRLTYSTDYSGEPTWSPDGSKIAFTTYRNQLWRIWVMNADGTNQVQLSDQPYSELPNWSPDGGRIAFDADADYDDMMELWVMNADGNGEDLMINGIGNSTLWANGWSPDGSYVTFTEVYLVYEDPYWYWYGASLYKWGFYGYPNRINPNRNTDFFLDWTTTDVTPPIVIMSALPIESPYQFTVIWAGLDGQSGLKNFDIQVRDGDNGAWTDWQMETTDNSAVFTGTGGHTYYFRVRARDYSQNLTSWPDNPHAYTRVESAAPLTHVLPVEPLTRGNSLTLTWEGNDPGGSGILYYDIQYMDEVDGMWVDWLTNVDFTSAEFTGQLGHTYHFRSRATDFAMNVEAWPIGDGDTSTAFFSWLISGTAADNTDTPVIGMDVTVDPSAFLTYPSDSDGKYLAYVGTDQEWNTVTWSKAGYETLPATVYGILDPYVNVVLPPADNVVADWGFESGVLPGDWQANGEYPPAITSTVSHSGDFAASLGTTSQLAPRAFINQAQYDSIAADQWGNLHMVRVIYENNKLQLYYDQRSPGGTWLPVEMVAELNYLYIYNITIAVDGFHNVHLLITPSNGWGIWDVVYVARDANGIWSDPQVVFPGSLVYDMVSDGGTKLHALVSYQGTLAYAHYELGGSWQYEPVPGVIYDNEASFTNGEQGKIFGVASSFAVGKQGEIHVVWTDQDKVYNILRRPGGTWTDARVLDRSGKEPENAVVLLDSLGRPHIIWDEWWSGGGLLYASVNPDGSWSTPFRLGNDWGEHLLLIDKKDILYAISHDADTEILFWQKPISGTWSAPQMISNSNGEAQTPVAVVGENGDLYVVWREYHDGCCYGVGFSSRHAGMWSIPVDLTDPLRVTDLTRIAVDAMGGVHILWLENESLTDLYYVGKIPLSQDGDSILSQSLTVPSVMSNPTLSFLAYLSGVSPVSGNEFSVQVTAGITTTTLFTSTTPTAWEHSWFDMSSWSGEQITLTFQLSEHAGFLPAQVLLDEVTLGAAHPDVWVELSGTPRYAKPGDILNLQLDYGNRGVVLAENTAITLTLPAGLSFVEASITPTVVGEQLVWQLGDLAGRVEPGAISLIVQVDADAVLGQAVTLEVTITTSAEEIELLNNQVEKAVYLGYTCILPIIRR